MCFSAQADLVGGVVVSGIGIDVLRHVKGRRRYLPMAALPMMLGLHQIGLKAFPAAVVGGFSSLPGAIVGGLVIGLVESFSGFYLPDGFKDVAAYVVVLIMLMVKPNGLFGEKLRKKV